MKRINIFVFIWVLIGLFLILISLHYRKQSDAIVAEVEPGKTAISFQKPVKIKAIYVIPGQEVMEGDLLMDLERPDLLFDIDQVNNQLNAALQEKKMFIDNINSQISILQLELQNEIKSLNDKILQLESRLTRSRDLIKSIEDPDILPVDSLGERPMSLTEIQLKALQEEKDQVYAIFVQKKVQLKEKKENEIKIYDLRIEKYSEEIEILEEEKSYLKNYSPINGTIGDVLAQIGELIPPYETILSIYEKHPRIIKAYMNEKNRYQLKVGDEVMVESSNRPYNVTGKVAEIGSRIVTYPNRLLIDQNTKIWGQEIFIAIPQKNQFLNGEKVYVRQK